GQTWFETLFNYTNFRVYNDYADNNDTIVSRHGVALTSIPLVVNAWPTDEGIRGYVAGNSDRYAASLINDMAATFNLILKEMIQGGCHQNAKLNPVAITAGLDEKSTLNRTEKTNDVEATKQQQNSLSQVCHFKNGRSKEDHSSFLENILTMARSNPNATAILEDENVITYGELLRLAELMSVSLNRNLNGSERVVAIYADASLKSIAAALATMLVGGVYLPIAKSTPLDRLTYMVEDTKVSLVISDETHLPQIDITQQRFAQLISAQAGSVAADNLFATRHPEQLAYIIYTSGSTGKPKGVGVPQKGIDNLTKWHLEAFATMQGTRMSQLASWGFDASAWEIWTTLSTGGVLCLGPSLSHTNTAELKSWLIEQKIEVAFVPTAFIAELVSLDWGECADLKFLLTGGDRLPTGIYQSTPFSVINNFGVTESSVVSTSIACQNYFQQSPPIGFPIRDTEVLLLDDFMNPVPNGIVGELAISSTGLARGYIGQPRLTAERFVPHPKLNGARLYLTGDKARKNSDGALEYIGRTDQQVSISGHRVECGEIARTIEAINPTLVASVIFDEQSSRLIVFYCSHSNNDIESEQINSEQIREQLRQKLPSHMLPNLFVKVAQMPLSNNGKIDTELLKVQYANLIDIDKRKGSAPVTEMERLIGKVWANVLQLPHVYKEDNFFELGGSSLAALRVSGLLNVELGKKLPISLLYTHENLEKFAKASEQWSAQSERIVVQLQEGSPSEIPTFIIHGGDGEVVRFTELAKKLSPSGHVYGIRFNDIDADVQRCHSVEALARLYAGEIIKHCDDRCNLSGWSLGGAIAYETSQQLAKLGVEVTTTVLLDSYAPEQIKQAFELSPITNSADNENAVAFKLSQMVSGYTPKPNFERPVVLLRASDQLGLEHETANLNADGKLGWSAICRPKIKEVNADHYSMLEQPQVAKLAKLILDELKLTLILKDNLLSNLEVCE
ncbi:amino acid adenylation domain-containing protein, partial [Pleionea sediminis]|uniref:amino acid adenylation domain-containing protein n=1 Tax=Pleionea sediminis TaxID=2569479 RepID=UPI0011864009